MSEETFTGRIQFDENGVRKNFNLKTIDMTFPVNSIRNTTTVNYQNYFCIDIMLLIDFFVVSKLASREGIYF